MSDRENDPGQQAIDPPENTRTEDAMSMDHTDEEPAQAIDPPENTGGGSMSMDSTDSTEEARNEAIDPPENTKTKQPSE